MPTDNLLFPTREELMANITLDYAPFFTVLNARAHDAKIENVKFTTVRGQDDIVAKVLNAQDTERAHVKAGESSKYYAKFFKGLQYAEDIRNARSALPEINSKVLKALFKQLDSEIWNGTDNNGIMVSSDPNKIANSSSKLPATIDGNNGLDALVGLSMSLKRQVEKTSSSKTFRLCFYGDSLQNYLLKTLPSGHTYGQILRGALPGVEFVDVPANLESTNNGIVVICPELVVLNHTLLPQVEKTGTDERDNEAWVNYIYGSAMVDVKEYGGLIVQPVTVAD